MPEIAEKHGYPTLAPAISSTRSITTTAGGKPLEMHVRCGYPHTKYSI
jgi:hypothetical protein